MGITGAQGNEADDLWNGEETDQRRHQGDAALQHGFTERESNVTAHRCNADGRQEQPEQPADESLEQ